MRRNNWVILAICVSGCAAQTVYWTKCGGTEQAALDWTHAYNTKTQEVWPVAREADWKYNTDITTENQDAMVL